MSDERTQLIATLRADGIESERVLDAIARVPREELVPLTERRFAYENRPLGIGLRQTISQPYIVALMTELAAVKPGDRVLEIGTGSGYQTAVLAALGAEVYTVEILPALALRGRLDLERLGLAEHVHFRCADGTEGWEGAAPFAAILVTAAPPAIPKALKAQLSVGGRLVIPVGAERQQLLLVRRTSVGFDEREVTPVTFVRMTGEAAC